jgi:hypothetical protein
VPGRELLGRSSVDEERVSLLEPRVGSVEAFGGAARLRTGHDELIRLSLDERDTILAQLVGPEPDGRAAEAYQRRLAQAVAERREEAVVRERHLCAEHNAALGRDFPENRSAGSGRRRRGALSTQEPRCGSEVAGRGHGRLGSTRAPQLS